jgi:hypothetical protein
MIASRAAASCAAGVLLATSGCGSESSTAADPARPSGPPPVLGKKGMVLNGKGWGTARPRVIFNGGSPGGLAERIRWRDWGVPIASGTGRIAAYRPEGGYYPEQVKVELRATRLGTCPGSRRRAYTRLLARSQTRPHGPMGDWHPWTLDTCDWDTQPRPCDSLGLEANSDAVATEITVWDTGCETAFSLARALSSVRHVPAPPGRGYSTYRRVTRGFVCNGSSFDEETDLPTISWNCVRGPAAITFRLS